MDISWVLFTIGIAIIFGKLGDHLMNKLGFPGVLGEMIMGMILGNLVYFGLVSPDHLTIQNNEIFDFLSRLGIIFLLFLGGLDTDLSVLKKTGKIATVSTVFGVLVPLVMGYLALQYMGYTAAESFAGGVVLTATSIGITVRVMMDMGVLKSEVGAASLSASIMDDFLGIMLIIFAVGTGSILGLLGKFAIFFIITGFLAMKLVNKFISFSEKLHVEKGILSLAIAVMFLFSFLAENWFEAAIEGSFMAGLVLSRTAEGKNLIEDVKTIGYSILIPLFFVYTGASLNLTIFGDFDALYLALVLTAIAIVSKVIGRGFGARIMGWNMKKSLQMGIGSIPRAEIALINLMVAIHAGVISESNVGKFIAATMIFITISIISTPPLLKWAFTEEVEN
ncbi:Kef-type K+ transport system membrane component KefB [Methanococcus maripaludis]|uniref:Kef-type K+ transport system membrane component KefB n=1 Tax=Methanococcus maripaludis TaxID=39152 RepID=A0A7J9NLK5_METMI|nr:cation:proton antiporter [Methanococcus maripaludis]MBA2845890.1 Kef-type K+ transport system membrane component KefB [Methanococcus maripaludis]